MRSEDVRDGQKTNLQLIFYVNSNIVHILYKYLNDLMPSNLFCYGNHLNDGP